MGTRVIHMGLMGTRGPKKENYSWMDGWMDRWKDRKDGRKKAGREEGK